MWMWNFTVMHKNSLIFDLIVRISKWVSKIIQLTWIVALTVDTDMTSLSNFVDILLIADLNEKVRLNKCDPEALCFNINWMCSAVEFDFEEFKWRQTVSIYDSSILLLRSKRNLELSSHMKRDLKHSLVSS